MTDRRTKTVVHRKCDGWLAIRPNGEAVFVSAFSALLIRLGLRQ